MVLRARGVAAYPSVRERNSGIMVDGVVAVEVQTEKRRPRRATARIRLID